MSDPIDDARRTLLASIDLEAAPARFDEALTHPSFANEHRAEGIADNQRLEFLGDAVLDLCVSEILLERRPTADEGVLSRAYGALVNAEALASWARANGVGPALRLGRGAAGSGVADRTNVLADAVEALLAAVYLDGGLQAARSLTTRIIEGGLARAHALDERDAKTTLQELVQAAGDPPPSYRVVETQGPDHDRWFVVEVEIGSVVVARGRGRTKKLAEQAAAAAALEAGTEAKEKP